MANEATQVEGPYEIHDFTVSNTTGIEQGTLCKLADPRTASATAGTADVFAGVAATEKVASDGSVELGLWTTGIFVMTAVTGGSITAGAMVVTSGANLIRPAVAGELLTGAVIGKAIEDIAAGSTGEVKLGASV